MPTLQRDELHRWWMDPNTFGTCLLALAIDNWGSDVMGFEPETIRLELRGAYGEDPPQVNMDKLLGLIATLSTNLFYISVETFTSVCEALNHSEANFQLNEPLEPEEAAWGVAEVTLNDEGEDSGRGKRTDQYSHEVKRYIGVALKQYGITQPPPILAFAEMDKPTGRLENTFTDDAAMAKAYYERQRADSEELTQFVRHRTLALIQQLQRLPLQHRDQDGWASFASKAQSRLGLSTSSG